MGNIFFRFSANFDIFKFLKNRQKSWKKFPHFVTLISDSEVPKNEGVIDWYNIIECCKNSKIFFLQEKMVENQTESDDEDFAADTQELEEAAESSGKFFS